jgi:hypothetical protein
MAREQLGDARQVDYRADLYGLGATAFRLFAGQPPYGNCPNLAQTIQTMASTRCVSLGQRRPDLPTSLVSIIDRMLETDPSQRPISALSVADQLKPFCVEQDSMDAIRVALKTTVVSERTSTGETIGGPVLAVAQPTRGWKPPFIRRVIGWTLAAMVPISFVAGVFLTLQTDRGTIVFETEEPNVSIQVKHEEQVVESLQILHDKPKTLILRSGQYRVEVTGLESDGLEVSNDTVSVLRGKKQIVRISKRGTSTELERNSESLVQRNFIPKPTVALDESEIQLAIWERLGVRAIAVPASEIAGISDDYKGGLKIIEVRPDSLAAREHLNPGDVIVGIMDWQTPTQESLAWIMANNSFHTASSVKYYLIRKGHSLIIAVYRNGKK